MLRLKVTGMTCGHCAQAVTRAVEALPQVERALVDIKTGEVSIDGDPDEAAVRGAIEEEGYQVVGPAASA
ncbi:heavy-metal-associated domain-containing protein [Arenibaculum pallidiluteum]|uniref:heavy-metal-associated domain-containing protein n=1 Tax=Arenibaculum pallidiluteum TaxID=2812559 RepID=UPI001A96BE9B|nr:cation transporter [Arenibaculum pallidiluteum]